MICTDLQYLGAVQASGRRVGGVELLHAGDIAVPVQQGVLTGPVSIPAATVIELRLWLTQSSTGAVAGLTLPAMQMTSPASR
jgi:hypothetical protein